MATEITVKGGYACFENAEAISAKIIRIPLRPAPSYCSIDAQRQEDGTVLLRPEGAHDVCMITSNGNTYTVDVSIEMLDKIFFLDTDVKIT